MAKDELTKAIIEKRQFTYKAGEVSLDFTLRVDNSSQLRSFRLCLEQAIKDIDKLLEGMKN